MRLSAHGVMKVFPPFEDEFCTHKEKAYDHVEIAVDKPSQYGF